MASTDDVHALLEHGQYEAAAELLKECGQEREAAQLLAKVWKFAEAAEVALSGGDAVLAFGYSLEANAPAKHRDYRARVMESPELAAKAAEVAEGLNRYAEAALLWESCGDLSRACVAYERADDLLRAALCHEAQGDYKAAGRLYEKLVVRQDEHLDEAALRLGKVLAHFSRWQPAAKSLQRVDPGSSFYPAALEMLVCCFQASGLPEAAASVLEKLRLAEPDAPATVGAFLLERFGSTDGLQSHNRSELLAGRYRVIRPLGAGGTGRVLLADDGFYDRRVAVKVLTVGNLSSGREAYVRFAREARIASGIDHDNVVKVYEFNEAGPFIVMEFMEGGTLESRLIDAEGAGELMPLAGVDHLVRSMLRGLEAVHRRGVVHRDLKPANVFFSAAGDVKIGDFGVAHLADLGATLTGAMLGTLAYMAPEQITGASKPSAATDFYALGVILHRVLTGSLPFPGPNFVEQHLNTPPPALSRTQPELGVHLDSFLLALLNKDVAGRPQSVDEVLALWEDIPWTELENISRRVTVVRSSSASPPMDSGMNAERYVELEPDVFRDVLLDRPVRCLQVTDELAVFLRRFAAGNSPYLQAVYDIHGGMAVLEEPAGGPAGAPAVPERAHLEAALEILHAHGLVHGAVDADHVRVGPGRTVLMLPLALWTGAKNETATPEDDRRRLLKLLQP